MLTTNREDYKKDLEEVIFMFENGKNLDISHFETNENGEFLDKFIVDGQTYNFKNFKNTTSNLELKRYEKRFSKLGLYSILKEKLNTKMPWGALTGIRPVKMAYSVKSDFEKEFIEVFDVSKNKIDLVKKIIKTQCKYLDRNGEFLDFYVGVPFCPSKCLYCSFMSREIGKTDLVNSYVDALIKEIEESKKISKNIRTIYIGGGTPVALDNYNLERLLKSLDSIYKDGVEYTVEAGRPDCITKEKLEILKRHNVNRICVNPQTFNDETLKIIGRKHTAKDIIDAYNLAKTFGFTINMDLIAGLPQESLETFKNSLNTAISLNPDNITVHTLCLKKGADLKLKTERLKENQIEEMIDYSHKALQNSGYNPYYLYRQKYMAGNLENTGYSKKGKECVYNIDVMEETSQNMACGAGAVLKFVDVEENRIERYGAPKDIKTYIDKVDEIIREKTKLFICK